MKMTINVNRKSIQIFKEWYTVGISQIQWYMVGIYK